MNLSVLSQNGKILSLIFLLSFIFGINTSLISQCAIGDIEVSPTPCDELGFFDVFLDFEYEDTGNEGFTVEGNGVNYGNFEYSALPILINDLEGDGITFYEFLVRDIQFPDCSNFAELGIIECFGGPCNIWDLIIDDHPCEEGMFSVYIDFEYENVSDSGFALYVNYDLYGTYAYSDLPLESVGPFAGDGTTVYHFYVADLVYDDCLEDANLGPIDCGSGDCVIGDIDVTILPCNEEDEFMVLLNFEYANTSDEFTVQGNGSFYGTFLYANLPVEIGPLLGDGVTVYEFGVSDAVIDDCSNFTAIDPVSCEGETAFTNFTTEVISCENEMYELQLNFEVSNGGSQGFKIIGNGQDYGSYDYSQLPLSIGPLPTDGETPYHFIAKDKEFLNFGNWNKLIPFTCESLGMGEPEVNHEIVQVYPNPSFGTVTFINLYGQDVSVYIYNSAGAETVSFTLTDQHRLSDLHAGIYYYRVVSEPGIFTAGKLIVTGY
jgi:hypothetical protein